MPAAAVKGIILSIGIITALSIAVLENEQVQAWLEEQRQKIAELLRSLGEELDPQSRRQAEAFAYEGRTRASDPAIDREVSGSQEAAAIATGRSLSNAGTVRRIPVQGRMDPDEAEERRRKGREYLAKRNQQMFEMQQRRKLSRENSAETPSTPTSFDAMVDEQGKLRADAEDKELPSPPAMQLLPEAVKEEMKQVERHLSQPLLVGESSAAAATASGWSFGSAFANPFSDEHALDRSGTPKPPVPPKVALDAETQSRVETPTLPGSFHPASRPQESGETQQDLSYEEQLAIALSLSEQEAQQKANATMSQRLAAEESDDPELRAAIAAAIAASLQDAQTTSPARSISPEPLATLPPQPYVNPWDDEETQPLVDLSPPTPTLQPRQPAPRGQWELLFDQEYSPVREPLSLAHSEPETEDELYSVTPDLPRAQLASLPLPSMSSTSSMPCDPVREAANSQRSHPLQQQSNGLDASFYSAVSSAPSPPRSSTISHSPSPTTPPAALIDISEVASPHEPTSPASFTFETDSDSDSDTFASISATRSRSHSRPRSEVSNVEVLDLSEDSDVDMLSQEGDGVATPDSWTEVGSRDGESEGEEEGEAERVRRV